MSEMRIEGAAPSFTMPAAPKNNMPSHGSGASFVDTLKSALGEVNEAIKIADGQAQKFATGEATNLHEVMISMEKADLSLRTLNSIRGKIVEAYQEIMKMPV
jgi:flagellar hook-basal body complex protein FliE